MAIEITRPHYRALKEALKSGRAALLAQLDVYERQCLLIEEACPADANHWVDAQYATQRTAIGTALHDSAAAMITISTALHDAAAAVVTDWT